MPSETNKKAETPSNKPVHVLRKRAIKVSVWANPVQIDGRDAVMHKVTAQKIYREGNDWKTTQSFGRDDLPVLQLLLGDAYRFILDAEAKPSKDEEVA